MSIKIGRYSFHGPYTSSSSLIDASGVYAIIDMQDRNNFLIDVGESATVKSRVESHDRRDCWRRNCGGKLAVAVYYTPNSHQTGRMEVEQEIRNQFELPCGSR